MTTPAGAVASDAQAAQRQAAKPGQKTGNFLTQKYGPLPGWAWSLIVGGGALAYLVWRKREAAKTSAATTSATAGATAAALSALQQEIDSLQYGTAVSTSSVGGGGTVSGGGGGGGVTGTAGTTSSSGTTASSTSGTTAKTTAKTTGSTTAKKTAKTTSAAGNAKPGAPLHPAVNNITSTSAELHWDAPSNAKSTGALVYNWTVFKGGKAGAGEKSGHSAKGGVTVTGLSPSTSYDFGVSATGTGGTGPASSRASFKTTAK
jgi:Fibronectin type III domain